MTVHQRVKEVRKYAGLTQESFAKKIGKTTLSITKNETGRTTPSGATLNAIIEEFGISRQWMHTGDGEMIDIVAKESESVPSNSWKDKAYDALQSHIDELKKQNDHLQDQIDKLINVIASVNFQSDVVEAAKIVKMDNSSDNIVRVEAA